MAGYRDSWPEPGPSTPRSQPAQRDIVASRAPTPARPWSESRRYAIFVDAGSSGSRLQVYSWKDPSVSRTERLRHGKSTKVLPRVEKGTEDGSGREWQWKVEPGISSFGNHPHDLDAYLQPLFAHALTVVPADRVQTTPVYIMATAGMRLIPQSQQDGIIEATCRFIQSSTPFRLQHGCKSHVRVITGEEEGLLGWIAINYLMDGFHFRRDGSLPSSEDAAVSPSKGKSTYGFLDMGGASTQIAFEPSKKALAAVGVEQAQQAEELSSVTLKLLDGTSVSHNVFVTTFLGFGTNKARERYEETLVHNATMSSSPTDPVAVLDDPCLPRGATTSKGSLKSPPFLGTGSFKDCLASLSPLLDKSAHCSRPPCLFHGIHVPPIDFSVNHFIGVSEYWFSSHDVFGLGGAYDYVSFQRAAEKFCARPWHELEKSLHAPGTPGAKNATSLPPQVDENRLRMQCFKSAWMVTVLHDGIGLPRVIDDHGKGDGKHHAEHLEWKAGQKNLGSPGDDVFQSVNEVEGTAVSWTLGQAVLEATKDIETLKTIGDEPSGSSSEEYTWRPPPPWYAPIDAHVPDSMRLHDASPLGLAIRVVVVIAAALLFVLILASRGNSAAAVRRRRALKSFFSLSAANLVRRPWNWSRHDTSGDYRLANMEAGADAHSVTASPTRFGDDYAGSDASSSEGELMSSPEASLPRTQRRGRRSGTSGFMSLVPRPLRGLAWKTASLIPGTTAARRARRKAQRRHQVQRGTDSGNVHGHVDATRSLDNSDDELYSRRDPLSRHGGRRAFSPTVMRESRAASPTLSVLPPQIVGGAISRPSSRSALSGRQSPRVLSTGGGSAALSLTPLSTSPPPPSNHQQQLAVASSGFSHWRPSSPSFFASAHNSGHSSAAVSATPVAWTSASSAVPSTSNTGTNTPRATASPGPMEAHPSLASISHAMRENQSRWAARNGSAHGLDGKRAS
ncbi:unnamed protein product [Parajaminaea phylloscopi]